MVATGIRPGPYEERVFVTLSTFLLSVLSGNAPHIQAAVRGSDGEHGHRSRALSPEQEDLRRCESYRKFFPMTEIELPATALRNRAIAKWVKDHRVAVDVRNGDGLTAAIAAGIHLTRMTVYADALGESELRAAVNLGVGRVVAGSVEQIELLRSVAAQRPQGVIIG
jgi:diaminopimelate decarboxylase